MVSVVPKGTVRGKLHLASALPTGSKTQYIACSDVPKDTGEYIQARFDFEKRCPSSTTPIEKSLKPRKNVNDANDGGLSTANVSDIKKVSGTAMLGVTILGLVGLARGWFSFSTQSESDQTRIELTIDKERLQQDTDRLKGRVGDSTDRFKSSSSEGSDQSDREILPPDMDAGGQF